MPRAERSTKHSEKLVRFNQCRPYICVNAPKGMQSLTLLQKAAPNSNETIFWYKMFTIFVKKINIIIIAKCVSINKENIQPKTGERNPLRHLSSI